ncbi:MAG: hypothetical protein DA408_10345 [Bacteroidetes bacterium]|nr:MAG: hypothetical protein C7N36_10210 [Bacteroidota bacterium]PTM12460.1 MAG: hypothetical protein DA408_10345 [Bacteroidota bacterium]
MKHRTMVRISLIAAWTLVIFEILTDYWFDTQLPGYNWRQESLSYLGQSGSPAEKGVLIWGVILFVLVSIIALAFYQTYAARKWVRLAVISLFVYGLGEGLGSGLPHQPTPYPGYARLQALGHYKSLRNFKEKLEPHWQMMYLVYSAPFDLIYLPYALEQVIQP